MARSADRSRHRRGDGQNVCKVSGMRPSQIHGAQVRLFRRSSRRKRLCSARQRYRKTSCGMPRSIFVRGDSRSGYRARTRQDVRRFGKRRASVGCRGVVRDRKLLRRGLRPSAIRDRQSLYREVFLRLRRLSALVAKDHMRAAPHRYRDRSMRRFGRISRPPQIGHRPDRSQGRRQTFPFTKSDKCARCANKTCAARGPEQK